MTAQESEQIKTRMLEQAKIVDATFLINAIASFPISKASYAQDPITKNIKVQILNIIVFRHWESRLIAHKVLICVRVFKQTNSMKVSMNGVEKEYKFSRVYSDNANLDILKTIINRSHFQ